MHLTSLSNPDKFLAWLKYQSNQISSLYPLTIQSCRMRQLIVWQKFWQVVPFYPCFNYEMTVSDVMTFPSQIRQVGVSLPVPQTCPCSHNNLSWKWNQSIHGLPQLWNINQLCVITQYIDKALHDYIYISLIFSIILSVVSMHTEMRPELGNNI